MTNSQEDKKILVTGGAGYIGSAAVKDLVAEGHSVVVLDNLSRGTALLDYIKSVATFYEVDLAWEKEKLNKVFENHNFDAVMHFAAYKSVEESMKNPKKYKDNIVGTKNLIEAMNIHNVGKIIYSSSAAVYKFPDTTADINIFPTKEEDALDPANYYGETKLQGEKIMEEFCPKYGITHIILRYFNVAGDGGLDYVDERPEGVFPIIMEVLLGKREEFVITGDDYPTRDGTCLRDYIHVKDLVRAHILALDVNNSTTLNLGTSQGYTVMELVTEVEKALDLKLNVRIGDRRAGDVAGLVASYDKAKAVMGWEPKHSIKEMILSTYLTHK